MSSTAKHKHKAVRHRRSRRRIVIMSISRDLLGCGACTKPQVHWLKWLKPLTQVQASAGAAGSMLPACQFIWWSSLRVELVPPGLRTKATAVGRFWQLQGLGRTWYYSVE